MKTIETHTPSAQLVGGWTIDKETIEYEIPISVISDINVQLSVIDSHTDDDVCEAYGVECRIEAIKVVLESAYYRCEGICYYDFVDELIEREVIWQEYK